VSSLVVAKIETHEFSDSGDGTCSHPVYQTYCGYPQAHIIHGYNALPADWFEDSSLETWFPLTAEELKRTKEENVKLKSELAELHQSFANSIEARSKGL
jgi:hypothetical protein